ncbi:hypothetical protein [Faecalimicrobium dakarense]|uniref:hypothetical protein n=1 Tax=Faecalimicrobium dakarense TaxID=1301100 RepID=UPI0004B43DA7|nr:hypothetical protein [[Clostridium] dakarense]
MSKGILVKLIDAIKENNRRETIKKQNYNKQQQEVDYFQVGIMTTIINHNKKFLEYICIFGIL